MKNEYPQLTQYLLDAISMHMDEAILLDMESQDWGHPGEYLTEYMRRDPDFPLHQFKTDSR